QWGQSGDIPITDWFNGPDSPTRDLGADLAVWRPSDGTWYIRNPASETWMPIPQGLPGDIPLSADFEGEFATGSVVWRPSDGSWNILPSSTAYTGFFEGFQAVQWGQAGDFPMATDFDGLGFPDFVVWRPSDGTWHILHSVHGWTDPVLIPESIQWG